MTGVGASGGDEFLVLASNTSQSALEAMASRILTRLRLPFRIGLIEVLYQLFSRYCTLSRTWFGQRGYYSSRRHSNVHSEGRRTRTILRFTPEMNQRVFEYLWLDTNLRKALENDQLVIHYQPKITGVAKCAVWKH